VRAPSLLLALALVGAASAEEPSTPARLGGLVLSRGHDRPLAGVTISAGGQVTITNGAGRFVLDALPPGRHTVELRRGAFAVTVEEELAPGVAREVIYRLDEAPPPDRFQSTVRAQLRREAVETVVAVDEARHVAGTQGDALKVVQDLPGVARASFGQGQLVVWGAAPSETRVTVDDVEVPSLYHVGGFRSVVNDALVRSIEFVPGAYGAAHGRALGGLVQLETQPLSPTGFHGYVGADLLDASALLSATVGDRFTLTLAGRYSYLDQLLSSVVSRDVEQYLPVPRWSDEQLRATLKLRAGESLALTFLGADDRLDLAFPSGDPARVLRQRTEQSFYRLSLRYARRRGDGSDELMPFAGHDHALSAALLGATPTRLAVDGWRYGLRAQARRRPRRWLWLTLGLDAQGVRSEVMRAGSLTLPPREGDVYVFGQPPAGDVGNDRFDVHVLDAAPYVAADVSVGPVTITPGLRADVYLIQGNQLRPASPLGPVPGFARLAWALDPRLALRWQAHPRVTVSAAVGLYHQAPDPADLSALFGNPTLGLSRAWHVTAGVAARPTNALTVEAAGFYRGIDDAVSRDPLATPPVAQALVQDGGGRSYGAQAIVRLQPWQGLSGFLSYTVGRSERQDHPGAALRLFDFDQTHVLTVVASWAWRGLTVGARFRYTTGFPRTPVVGAYYDARDDRFDPLFGAQNTIRLPAFVQLDARADYAWKLRRATIDVYLDVQNVTDQRNAEEIVYHDDYSNHARPGYVTGLPTLAVAGARVEF